MMGTQLSTTRAATASEHLTKKNRHSTPYWNRVATGCTARFDLLRDRLLADGLRWLGQQHVQLSAQLNDELFGTDLLVRTARFGHLANGDQDVSHGGA